MPFLTAGQNTSTCYTIPQLLGEPLQTVGHPIAPVDYQVIPRAEGGNLWLCPHLTSGSQRRFSVGCKALFSTFVSHRPQHQEKQEAMCSSKKHGL